jgi:hypothetical protein
VLTDRAADPVVAGLLADLPVAVLVRDA